jgi:predicted transposase YbfD/YdcC
LLVIALCTVLCGGQGAVDMALFARAKEPFLRGFLKLANGVPSHDTFSRLFRQLDPVQFRAAFQRFMASFSKTLEGVVAIDGKVLRRSFDRASGKSPLHMVSVWGCKQRLVLAQIATDAKSNEITAVPKLLRMLSLKGTIVTTDALNCQRGIAQQIVDQGGDYVLALKGNHGTLHDDVTTYLDDPAAKVTAAAPTVDADHGRIETRTATVSTDVAWLRDDHQWPGLAAIGKVVRIRETPAKTTTETAYYLLSTPLSAERLNESPRNASTSLRGTPQRGCPLTLGGRKPPALAPRCRDERGPGQEPIGQWPGKPCRSPTHGDERHAKGRHQGIPARKAQASGMG